MELKDLLRFHKHYHQDSDSPYAGGSSFMERMPEAVASGMGTAAFLVISSVVRQEAPSLPLVSRAAWSASLPRGVVREYRAPPLGRFARFARFAEAVARFNAEVRHCAVIYPADP